jgi:hypothetical protein
LLATVRTKETHEMRSLMLAALGLLALASAGAASTTHCTTREDPAFKRWVTECSDGSRAVTRYDETFNRYRTDVITPPKGNKPPYGWPVPGKVPR